MPTEAINTPEVDPSLLVTPSAESTSSPRWKVGVYSLVCDICTVYADTPAEAIEAVSKGKGRHAGSEGPEIIGTAAVPFNSPLAKNFIMQWVAQMHKQHPPQKEPPHIIVPSLVMPKGLT